jgi:hypothetical protein
MGEAGSPQKGSDFSEIGEQWIEVLSLSPSKLLIVSVVSLLCEAAGLYQEAGQSSHLQNVDMFESQSVLRASISHCRQITE